MQYAAAPLSRYDIHTYAKSLREKLQLKDRLYFPVTTFLEIFPKLINDDDFYFEIVADDSLPESIHAEYSVEDNCVRIRQSVYDGACAGSGRDRMTIMHELSHVILIKICGIRLYRTFDNVPLKPYLDPEWQAKCLAGELMMDTRLIKGMSAHQVSVRCGVSLTAAQYQLSKLR
jgi:Zn-dependent peptidase ImmA (M78 family)